MKAPIRVSNKMQKGFKEMMNMSSNEKFTFKICSIGVARIFDWGGPNHESHAMTHQKFSKKEVFVGQRYCRMEDLKV